MFAQRVRAPQRKASTPAKDSPKSESANLDAAPETMLANAPAYSYSLASMPIVPPPKPPSAPPPAKPATALSNSLPSSLAIGAADDPHEREADKAAGNALSPSQQPVLPSLVSLASSTFASAPPIVHQVLSSPGQPLHSAARALFESRFGYDLSHIRVHTDAQAAASADAIHARAYAAGNRIVFAPGQYGHTDPDRTQLLAHELAHVIQQDSSSPVLRRQPATPVTTPVQVGPDTINLPQGSGGNGAVIYTYTAHTKLRPKSGEKANQVIDVDMPLLVYPPAKIDTSKSPPSVDIFIFFHGMRASYDEESAQTEKDNSDKGYTKDHDNAKESIGQAASLQKAAETSGRLVIVPQGPTTWRYKEKKDDPGHGSWSATSGQWTEALESAGFDGVIDAALAGLSRDLKLSTPLVAGSIHVAGHSAGGRGIVESVSSKGAAKYRNNVQDLTLQDAGYGGPDWASVVDWMLDSPSGKTVRVLMSKRGGASDATGQENTRVAVMSALNPNFIRDAIKNQKKDEQFEVVEQKVPATKDQQPLPLGFHLESELTIRDKKTGVLQATLVVFYSTTASHYPTVTGTMERAAKAGPGDTTTFLGDISPGPYRVINGLQGSISIFKDNKLKKPLTKLPTSTPVEVIAVDPSNPRIAQVKIPSGDTGWVSSDNLARR